MQALARFTHRLAPLLLAGSLLVACLPPVTVAPAACYALTLSHSGEGADPSASPASSPGCSNGSYVASATIKLSAAAPAAPWQIDGWSGTVNDASKAATNTVKMPAADHTASVVYAPNAVNLTGNFRVTGSVDKAWATLTGPDQFTQITASGWQDLFQDGYVTTDILGEAQVCTGDGTPHSGNCSNQSGACRIYVFWSSELKYSGCAEGSTNVTFCTYDGTQAFRDCDARVQTLSADVQGLGTWFTVTYLAETQITLVILLDGKVQVTPVKALSFETPALPGSPGNPGDLPTLPEFKLTQRELGEPQTGQIDPGSDQAIMVYTAPDARLQELGLTGLAARSGQWQGIDGLNDLRAQLRLVEPNLEPWLQTVWQTATVQAGYKLPPLGPLAPAPAGLVLTAYGSLANAQFANALGSGVDWTSVVDPTFGAGFPAGIHGSTLLDGEFNLVMDARGLKYNPDLAMRILRENKDDDLTLKLLITDEKLSAPAEKLQAYLGKIGLHAESLMVGTADLKDLIRSLLEQDAPFLSLALR